MRCLVFCTLVLLVDPLWAQVAAPSTEQMIQQLKAPRTRSLRNLTVEAVPNAPATTATAAEAVAAPAPDPSTAAASDVSEPAVATMAPEPRPSLSLNIQFDFDSSRIRTESLEPLANLAAALASPVLLESKFLIEGHTDAKGSAAYNRKLSDQRAGAVKALLVSKGIGADRLVSVGKGSSEPANRAEPLAAENRRVKVVNLD